VLPEDGRITETCRSRLIFYCFRHFKLKKLTLSAFVGNKQSIDLKMHGSTIKIRYLLIPNSHFLILTERNRHYSVHRSPLMVHILIEMNPVYPIF
jgi:hypothetical protein